MTLGENVRLRLLGLQLLIAPRKVGANMYESMYETDLRSHEPPRTEPGEPDLTPRRP